MKQPTTVTELPGEPADCDQAMLCKLFGAPSTPADAPQLRPGDGLYRCGYRRARQPGAARTAGDRAQGAGDNPVPADELSAEPIKNVELRQLHPEAPRWDENGLSPQPSTIGFPAPASAATGSHWSR